MFRWRRRNEGFEWRTYVRTTVLARRAKRRQQVEDVKQAAIEQARLVKERGARAGLAGLDAGRRQATTMAAWLAEAGRSGAGAAWAALVEGGRSLAIAARRAWSSARSWTGEVGVPALGAGLRSLRGASREVWSAGVSAADRAGEALRPGFALADRSLAPAMAFLRRPDIDGQLLVAGGGLMLAALARGLSRDLDAAAWLTVLAAVATLAVPLGSRLLAVSRATDWGLGRMGDSLRRALPFDLPQIRPAHALLVATGAVLAVGAGYWALNSGPARTQRGTTPVASGDTLAGKAVAVSGDMLRIDGGTVRLAGIEAPERDQECERPGGVRWSCGVAAAQAVARLVRGRAVTCRLSGRDDGAGHRVATCHAGDDDIAAALVRGGHVFAELGLLSPYGHLETEARGARAGFWRGTADRPSEYRAKRWDVAKRQAPDGCPIKGQQTAEGRVYVLPWSGKYDKIKLRLGRGDRWFCTEDEARAAGWKPS